MSLSQQQQIFTQNIARLILYANSLGVNLTFGEANRTKDQQYLYYHGLTIEDGKLVKAEKRSWTMDSDHLRRLAIDFNFFIHEKYIHSHPLIDSIGRQWENLHFTNKWGVIKNGKQVDSGHFAMKI